MMEHTSSKPAIAIGRTFLLGLVAVIFSVTIVTRLVMLYTYGSNNEVVKAELAELKVFKPIANKKRGDIFDRNGLLLATNLLKPSLCANGHILKNPEDTAIELLSILPDLDPETAFERLSAKRTCTFVQRAITREQQYQINKLGVVGLDFQEEEWRVYPHANLTSHVVGFASPDNIGLAGVEQALNEHLIATGDSIELSIDVRVQNVLREELKRALDLHEAKFAAGVLIDANSAEVLAMVSLPDFDPNQPQDAKPDTRFNRASHGVYELGSVMKIFTAAMALESGLVGLEDGFSVGAPIQVSGTDFTITDFAPTGGKLNLEGILRRSSNIGAAKVAQKIGQEVQERFLRDLGVLTPLNFEVPEVGKPAFPATWRDVNTMTIAYGHGLSISPLQMVSSTAALVNGGIYRQPTLLKRLEGAEDKGERVMSEDTSIKLRRLMEVVVKEGSGKRAKPNGYSLGGKTGTAEKAGVGAYSETNQITSFIGAFPIDKPKYVLLTMIDEPKVNLDISTFATAGIVAAPIARHFIERAAPLLNLAPDEPQEVAEIQDK